MKTNNLGCLTRSGIIAFALSILLFGTAYLFKQNAMFSPGELSDRTTGRSLLGYSSHSNLSQDCQLCHPAPWDSTNMADLCLDCHQDIQEQLLDINSLHGLTMLNMTSIDCRACHTDHKGPAGKTTEFSGEDFPHDLAGFSLQSHQVLDTPKEIICADCHSNSFLNFDPTLCQDCHQQINPSHLDVSRSCF